VSLIGNIMNAEPPALATTLPLTPPALDRVVRKCLAKHPDDRWDGAHDVADELRWIAQTTGAERPRRPGPRLLAAAIAGALVVFAAGAGLMWLLRPPAPSASPARVSLDVRPADEVNAGGMSSFIPTPGGSRTALTWTPDGRALVFAGRRGGAQQLYVRQLEGEARPLANTQNAQVLAVSPDGKWVAFWAGGAIKRIPLAGGVAAEVASGIAESPDGLVWDSRGGLYFGKRGEGIWTVPADGKPASVTTVGDAEFAHTLPSLLPGDRVLLYTVRKREWSWGDESVVAQPLPAGERRLILTDATDARYVPATGHLLFLRRGALWAVPFDADRLRVRGRAVPVLDGVAQALTAGNSAAISGAGQFAVSQTGTLAWVAGRVAGYLDQRLVTVDRRGQVTVLSPDVRSYGLGVRLSPDGRRLAVSVLTLQERGIWVYDLARGTLAPLNRDGESSWPAWTTDGRRIAFSWLRDGRQLLAMQGVDDQSAAQVLAPGLFWPSSWNTDGRTLAGVGGGRNAGDVLIATRERGNATVQPLGQTSLTEQHPAFSPDGRWLAYVSNASDSNAVYIRPYPGPGEVTLASPDRCSSPAWNPRGGELFFIGRGSLAGRLVMMAVDIALGPALRVGPPRVLFEFDALSLQLNAVGVRAYDVAPDGQRFYGVQMVAPASPPAVTHINLIQNWFEELKAQAPTER
jgi:serine/threonine-protein kinase